MKPTIAVYDTHDKAVTAIQALTQSGYPATRLSLIGKANLIDGHVQIHAGHENDKSHIAMGVAAAAVVEVLAIVGIVAVPGFGLLFGAGAAIIGFTGLTTALLAGGDVRAIFTGQDISDEDGLRYEEYLIAGKFLVFADGDEKEQKQARQVLQGQGAAIEIA